jgi:uncharacterized sulfatase
MNRPNIIFYFSDQQRWDTLGCYGQKLDVTPTLDGLAASGVRFEYAFTCQPVCGPARAVLQTGRYAAEVGCFRNAISLPVDAMTVPKYLSEAGYDTAYVGKWHLASDRPEPDYRETAIPPEKRGGFKDYWMASDVLEFTSRGYNGYVHDGDGKRHDFIGYRADCVNNYAVDFVRNHRGENPFFLFVSQIEPHHQNDRNRYEGPDGSKARFKDYEVPGDLAGTGGDWRENYPDYLGCCRSLDDNLARLIDTLKDKGIYENTVILYTTDHGSHFRTRNREYKRSCHDGCLRIPMIAHGPGFTGGQVSQDLVSLIDIPATILDCAGLGIPAGFRGRSLKELASGQAEGWRDAVFAQISESHIGRCIRTVKWKYSVRADGDSEMLPGSDTYYEDFLYDLETDPCERINRVADPAYTGVRAALAKKLIEAMQDAGEAAPKILPFRS